MTNSPLKTPKKVKITGRYRIGLYGGIGCGILAAVIQLTTNLPAVIQFKAKQEIAQQTEIEKLQMQAETDIKTEEAKQQKRQATSFSENEVNPVKTFSLWGYVDNPRKKPRIDFRAFPKSSQKVYIFDASNRCIGYVQSKKFYWKYHYKGICKGIGK